MNYYVMAAAGAVIVLAIVAVSWGKKSARKLQRERRIRIDRLRESLR